MRILIVSIALVFLGTLSGCVTTGSNGCSSGCSTSGYGGNGCRTNGCKFAGGGGHVSGNLAHSHGICDCEYDDYCSSRSPWVRHGGVTPVGLPVAPVEPIPAPSKLPDPKLKRL